MLDGPQILGVHDISAMLILKGWHILVGTIAFAQQNNITRWLTKPQRWDYVTLSGLRSGMDIILPAASIGASTLVRVPAVHIAGEQAAARVGNAERTMDKHLKFCIRALLANLLNLIEGKFTGENNPAHALLRPKFDRSKIHHVRLYREMHFHFWPPFTHHHNQSWIGHNQGIWLHGNHWLHIAHIGFHLGVMGGNIAGEVEFFTQLVRFLDTFTEILKLKIVITHPQTIAGLPGVYRISTIRISKAHVT